MGQQHTVHVIKLVALDIIEAKMNELQARKRDLIEEVIDPVQGEAAHLTEEDIMDLL